MLACMQPFNFQQLRFGSMRLTQFRFEPVQYVPRLPKLLSTGPADWKITSETASAGSAFWQVRLPRHDQAEFASRGSARER